MSFGLIATPVEDAMVLSTHPASLDCTTSENNKKQTDSLFTGEERGGTRAFLSWGNFYFPLPLPCKASSAAEDRREVCPETSAHEYLGNQDEVQPKANPCVPW